MTEIERQTISATWLRVSIIVLVSSLYSVAVIEHYSGYMRFYAFAACRLESMLDGRTRAGMLEELSFVSWIVRYGWSGRASWK
jgi:hypothetical protein